MPIRRARRPETATPRPPRADSPQRLRDSAAEWVDGNRLDWLDAAHAAPALAQARDHVNADVAFAAVARDTALADALLQQAHRGVAVNLMLRGDAPSAAAADWLARLQAAGATVGHDARRWRGRDAAPSGVAVVDGSAGWWIGDAAPQAALRLQGPVVSRLQRWFVAQWQRRATAPLRAARYFPPVAAAGSQAAALAALPSSGAAGRSFEQILVAAIALARHRVVVGIGDAPPSRPLRAAIDAAARRGVAVELRLAQADAARAWSALADWLAPRWRGDIGIRRCAFGATPACAGRAALAAVVDATWSGLGPTDALAGAPGVAVVDGAFARQFAGAWDAGVIVAADAPHAARGTPARLPADAVRATR